MPGPGEIDGDRLWPTRSAGDLGVELDPGALGQLQPTEYLEKG